MMKLIDAKCPNCGGKLQLPSKLEKAHCMYCGTEIIIAETEVHITGGVIACPECGGYGTQRCPKCTIHYIAMLQLFNKGQIDTEPKEGVCIDCDGEGTEDGINKCDECQGTGKCDVCGGTGKVKCDFCNGTGKK